MNFFVDFKICEYFISYYSAGFLFYEKRQIPSSRGWGKGQGPCHLMNSQGYDPENCMCRFTVSLRVNKFVA